jgi:hypothetical protein
MTKLTDLASKKISLLKSATCFRLGSAQNRVKILFRPILTSSSAVDDRVNHSSPHGPPNIIHFKYNQLYMFVDKLTL